MQHPRTRRSPLVSALTGAAAFATFLTACGSRGPLDIDVINVTENGDGGPGTMLDGAVDASPLDASAHDSATTDATPRKEAGLIDCGLCLAQQCGAPILKCIQNTACRTTFQCAAMKCLQGGSPDLPCLLQCANGDPAGIAQLIGIFQCVAGKCGSDCTSLLGGLGGLGGGGGGRDAGRRSLPDPSGDVRREVIAESFSRWPELCSR